MALSSNPTLQSHKERSKRLVLECGITSNATPASKTHISDLPAVAILRTEGKTSEADAVETITWTAAADNSTGNSVFGILINLPEKADRVSKVTISEKGTALASSLAVTGPSAAAGAYLTSAGNVAIEIAGTGLNLASESPTLVVEVEYREAL